MYVYRCACLCIDFALLCVVTFDKLLSPAFIQQPRALFYTWVSHINFLSFANVKRKHKPHSHTCTYTHKNNSNSGLTQHEYTSLFGRVQALQQLFCFFFFAVFFICTLHPHLYLQLNVATV